MALWGKSPAITQEHLSSVPGTLMMKGKSQFLKVRCPLSSTCTHTHPHTNIK